MEWKDPEFTPKETAVCKTTIGEKHGTYQKRSPVNGDIKEGPQSDE